MSAQDHVTIINEDEEKQISEERTTTGPQAEPDVYTEHDVHLEETSTDSIPLPAQPLNPPEQIQINLTHHSTTNHSQPPNHNVHSKYSNPIQYHHHQSITPEPNHLNHHIHPNGVPNALPNGVPIAYRHHSNDNHPDLPPPPAFTMSNVPNVSNMPNVPIVDDHDFNPMHNAVNAVHHPMVRQLVDMGFPELYVLRACKIFEVKSPPQK